MPRRKPPSIPDEVLDRLLSGSDPRDARHPHVMNKIRLFEASPYDQTMFVDADCLLMKHDVDRYWAHAAQHFFCITGTPERRGEWKGIMIEGILRERRIDYMVVMNAGILYFDRSEASRTFFSEFEAFYLAETETLAISNYKGKGSHSFELYLGIFLGMKDMKHVLMPNFDNNSWMVTTWRIAFCRFDIAAGRSEVYKLSDFLFGIPVLPTKVVRLSPTFPHFVGLKPKRTYARLAGRVPPPRRRPREAARGSRPGRLTSVQVMPRPLTFRIFFLMVGPPLGDLRLRRRTRPGTVRDTPVPGRECRSGLRSAA